MKLAGKYLLVLTLMAVSTGLWIQETHAQKGSKPGHDLTNPIRKKWTMQRLEGKALPMGWQSASGDWQITKEPQQPVNKVLRQKELRRSTQMLLSRADYANFEFSVRLRADTFDHKTKNWQMGVIFRRRDDQHYYKCRLTAANIALIRYDARPSVSGKAPPVSVAGVTGKRPPAGEEVLFILPIGSKPDQWHTLSIGCYGDRITVGLNGKEVRVTNDAGMGAGKIGVFTYKTQAYLDDLKLSYLPLPPQDTVLLPAAKVYTPGKDDHLIIYFTLPQAGKVELSVVSHRQTLFDIVSKGYFSAGLNTVAWSGQGLMGKQPQPGRYDLVLSTDHGKHKAGLTIR